MRVFGVGMLAEFASKDSYHHFLLQRYHFYTAMERRFDAVSSSEPNGKGVASLWPKFEMDLRQRPALIADLAAIGENNTDSFRGPSPATEAYIKSIDLACSDLLLGHFYCRYFADLFGGSMIGMPTKLALGIPDPQFYRFPSNVEAHRGDFIESIYENINTCGKQMGSDSKRQQVVNEAADAFTHNANIIKEQGVGVVSNAILGTFNVGIGFIKHSISR
jgi:heme oxygenase